MFTEITQSSWLKIASTTNENILTETLLKEVKDDKTRFAILNHYLDGFKGKPSSVKRNLPSLSMLSMKRMHRVKS